MLVHRVVFGVEQVVGRQADGSVELLDRLASSLEDLVADARVARGNEHEQHDASAVAIGNARQRVQQQVDALVVELVTSGDRQQRRVGDVLAEKARCELDQLAAHCRVVDVADQLVDDVEVDAVGEQRIRPALVQ